MTSITLWRLLKLQVAVVFSMFVTPAIAESDIDFSDQYERIFQIRVVSPDAGGKSSIGSGFQVSASGHIVTNYHVISSYIESPDAYSIEYAAQDGSTGKLELLDFDVISDLALLSHPLPAENFFNLQQHMPAKGELAYALGNPGDWGMVMVPGPTNGFVQHSYEQRVLFSGSLNPGMSGGPSLNADGEVIGVNVATAGSQLSFLVPAIKAQRLLDNNRHLLSEQYMVEIANQIKQWQRPRVQELLDMQWPAEEFMDKKLFGEIRHDFQCWGDTNESTDEREIAIIKKYCNAGDDIYINYDFSAGQIHFSFRDLQPIKLNQFQFARTQQVYMSAANDSTFEQSTNYQCQSDFVNSEQSEENKYNKIVTCIRAYKQLPDLYDSLLMVFSSQGNRVFKSRLKLSTMERVQITEFNKRFIEATL